MQIPPKWDDKDVIFSHLEPSWGTFTRMCVNLQVDSTRVHVCATRDICSTNLRRDALSLFKGEDGDFPTTGIEL